MNSLLLLIQKLFKKPDLIQIMKTNKTKKYHKESISTMLTSEEVLKKDWNNKSDEKWNEL